MQLMIFTLKMMILALLLSCFVSTQIRAEDKVLPDEDVELIISQAKSGDAEAQFCYAMMLDMGDRVAMDKPAAITWYQKAASQGLPAAYLYLGMKYEFGNTVAQNTFQAIHWYRKAALQNWPDAQFHLGRVLLERGDKKEDIIEAVAWLSLAEEWGFPSADEEKKKAAKLLSKQERIQAIKLLDKLRQQIERNSE